MASNHHDDEVFQKKRRPKNPIKFQLQLNDEQKQAKLVILNNAVTVLNGMAGSGKTLLATQCALDALFRKEVEKIIITRPTVAKEEIGFLPGDIREKMDPWLAPIYHNFFVLYNKTKIEKHLADGDIEIVPFSFIRGRTFLNSFIIVDEAQNVTNSLMQAVLGRIGKGSRCVICGDLSQVDLRDKYMSGFPFLNVLAREIDSVAAFTLKKNHRHPVVADILKVYENIDSYME